MTRVQCESTRGWAAKAVKAPRGWENQGLSSCSLCLRTPPIQKKPVPLGFISVASGCVGILLGIFDQKALKKDEKHSKLVQLATTMNSEIIQKYLKDQHITKEKFSEVLKLLEKYFTLKEELCSKTQLIGNLDTLKAELIKQGKKLAFLEAMQREANPSERPEQTHESNYNFRPPNLKWNYVLKNMLGCAPRCIIFSMLFYSTYFVLVERCDNGGFTIENSDGIDFMALTAIFPVLHLIPLNVFKFSACVSEYA